MRNQTIRGRLRLPGHATLAAYLALFLALSGGTAVALKGKNTVLSDDIKNNQVKGADVNEQSLGEVPTAAQAGTAANAGSLGGLGAGQYTIGGARVLTAYAELPASGATVPAPILTLPEIGVIRGLCEADGNAALDFDNASGQTLRVMISRGSSSPTLPNPVVANEVTNGNDSNGANSAENDTFLIQVSPTSTNAPVKVATVNVAVREEGDHCEYGWQGASFPRG